MQVEKLMSKGYIRENISSCIVSMLLFAIKKKGTLRICVDCHVVNNIIVKYRYLILRLDDILDELHDFVCLQKLVLKVDIIILE